MTIWPFHRHHWAEVGRQFLTQSHWGSASGQNGPVTYITFKCTVEGCPRFHQETLWGHVGLPKGGIEV